MSKQERLNKSDGQTNIDIYKVTAVYILKIKIEMNMTLNS